MVEEQVWPHPLLLRLSLSLRLQVAQDVSESALAKREESRHLRKELMQSQEAQMRCQNGMPATCGAGG